MGLKLCCCQSSQSSSRKKIVLLLVGLDEAGKSTICKALAGECVENPIPTVGFSTLKLKNKQCNVTIYDLGGGPKIRDIWPCYFSDVYGIIYVVDSSNVSRMEEARKLLESILTHEKLAGKPVLVLANKQDLPDALDEIDLVESLKLEPLVNQQKCITLVELCSAIPPDHNIEKLDKRIYHGYRWLVQQVLSNYTELNKRVIVDAREQEIRANKLREEWKKRRQLDSAKSSTRNSNISKNINGMAGIHSGQGDYIVATSSLVPDNSILESPKEKVAKILPTVRSKRNNKIHPHCGSSTELPLSIPNIDAGPNGPILGEQSMTVRALTSPPIDGPSHSTHNSIRRPLTAKTVQNEHNAWGLEKELKLPYPTGIHFDDDRADVIEYFRF